MQVEVVIGVITCGVNLLELRVFKRTGFANFILTDLIKLT